MAEEPPAPEPPAPAEELPAPVEEPAPAEEPPAEEPAPPAPEAEQESAPALPPPIVQVDAPAAEATAAAPSDTAESGAADSSGAAGEAAEPAATSQVSLWVSVSRAYCRCFCTFKLLRRSLVSSSLTYCSSEPGWRSLVSLSVVHGYFPLPHLHLSLNRRGRRWGTTDVFTISFLHFSLFSTALWDLANSRPVHSLMLSSYLFLSALSSFPFHCALQDGFG